MNRPATTLFISDLHLMPEATQVTELFMHFCQQIAPMAEAVYILGDFFEVWVGDDDDHKYIQRIQDALMALHKRGIKLYFLPGNRDFLLGDKFCARCGITRLPDPTCITLYDQVIVLTHGDFLCTSDHAHQRFRRWTSHSTLQWLFLRLPLSVRRRMAKKLREKSRGSNHLPNQPLGEIDCEASDALIKQYQAAYLIHGHIHQAARHPVYSPDNKPIERVTLGDWGSTGSYLAITESGACQLHTLKA